MGAIAVGDGACGVGHGVVDVSQTIVLQCPLEGGSRGFDEAHRDGEVVVIGRRVGRAGSQARAREA